MSEEKQATMILIKLTVFGRGFSILAGSSKIIDIPIKNKKKMKRNAVTDKKTEKEILEALFAIIKELNVAMKTPEQGD